MRLVVLGLTERAGAMASASVCVYCTRDLKSVLLCESCRRVQPLPGDADAFAILGLPRRLALESGALEERFHALSRHLHPDRFHGAGELDRARSLSAAAALNRAYRSLRDAPARARYWLELGGAGLGEEQKTVPAELAEEAFEVHEIIEEAQDAKLSGDRASARGRLKALRSDLTERLAAQAAALDALFVGAGDAGPEDAALRTRLQQALSRYNYANRQVLNIDAVLDA